MEELTGETGYYPGNPFVLDAERRRRSDMSSNLSSQRNSFRTLASNSRTAAAGGMLLNSRAGTPNAFTQSFEERRQRLLERQVLSQQTVSEMLAEQESLSRQAQQAIVQRAQEFSARNSQRLSGRVSSIGSNTRASGNTLS